MFLILNVISILRSDYKQPSRRAYRKNGTHDPGPYEDRVLGPHGVLVPGSSQGPVSRFSGMPSRSVIRKMCSNSLQQIYRRTSIPKYDLSKVTSRK